MYDNGLLIMGCLTWLCAFAATKLQASWRGYSQKSKFRKLRHSGEALEKWKRLVMLESVFLLKEYIWKYLFLGKLVHKILLQENVTYQYFIVTHYVARTIGFERALLFALWWTEKSELNTYSWKVWLFWCLNRHTVHIDIHKWKMGLS